MAITMILCLFLLLVGLAQTPAGQSVTRSIGLASSAQPFTELYFNQPSRLATLTEGDAKGVAVAAVSSFVIRNEQPRAMTYYWTIQANGTPLLAGRHDLGPGQKVTIEPRLRDPCSVLGAAHPATRGGSAANRSRGRSTTTAAPARVKVEVSIEHPAEAISYWEPCHG